MCILAAGDEQEARRAGNVRALWPSARFAVGVHPHQARECAGQPGRAERLLRDAFASPDVVAVGEIGLDYHYDFSPRDVQHDVFVEQLATARALGAPVAIHTREADEDTFTTLAQEGQGSARSVPLLHRRRRAGAARARPGVSPVAGGHPDLPEGHRPGGGRASSPRPTVCWSRPTVRFSRRCLIAGSATSRRLSHASSTASRRSGGRIRQTSPARPP